MNYEILHKNRIVAVWRDNNLEVTDSVFLPSFFKRNICADEWLATRAIDCHRPNSRLLKKALRVKESDDVAVAFKANGVTITDNYWVREIGSQLTYEDVCFKDNYFSRIASNLALFGSAHRFNNVATHEEKSYIELTNTGSFEKCWRYNEDDKSWYLHKVANRNERFSEIFIYMLGQKLGIDTAEYRKKDGIVISKDFSNNAKYDFEPAFYFVGDEEEYEYNFTIINKICQAAISGYVKMIFLDALAANPDRHTGNYGLLRNSDTGEYIGFAPLYDHNMALISRGYPKSTTVNKKDMLIDLFAEFISNHKNFKEYIPKLSRQILDELLDEINMKVKKAFIAEYLINRYDAICERIV